MAEDIIPAEPEGELAVATAPASDKLALDEFEPSRPLASEMAVRSQ